MKLAKLHGAFYLATGLWPLIHRRSFEAVTGPKTDWWLVQTVGVLVSGIGLSFLLSDKERSKESRILAISSALGLAGIDILYNVRKRISSVYLLDAAVEIGLAGAWLREGFKKPRRVSPV